MTFPVFHPHFLFVPSDWNDFSKLGLVARRLRLSDFGSEIHEILRNLEMTTLHTLNLSGCEGLTQVDRLGDCKFLHTLNLSGCEGLTHVDRLGDCKFLRTLNLTRCSGLTQVDRLGDCPSLHTLNLSDCYRLTQVNWLGDCPSLHTLNLSYCLHLSYCDELTSVDRLLDCPNLHNLFVTKGSRLHLFLDKVRWGTGTRLWPLCVFFSRCSRDGPHCR